MNFVEVERFAGVEADVNAYIVSSGSRAIVIDALRNRQEAARLAQRIQERGLSLESVLVTHGHPDHYIGVRTLHEAFPVASVIVASDAVKRDMIAFSAWMESVGWLEQQPQMKPRSARCPDGFDYEGVIEVMAGDRVSLGLGAELVVRVDYPPTECAHMTTIECSAASAVFVSDLCYRGVHAWAGTGVLREHISNWMDVLSSLETRYGGRGWTVYPGHGAPSDESIFSDMDTYLRDFLRTVDEAASDAEAVARMKQLYPEHRQADFLLAHSVAFHGPDGRKGGV